MRPDERGEGSGGPRRAADRRASWRSIAAGFVLIAAVFAALVAVSHPVAAGVVLAIVVGSYALVSALPRTSVDRTVQVCRPRVCLQFRLRVG